MAYILEGGGTKILNFRVIRGSNWGQGLKGRRESYNPKTRLAPYPLGNRFKK